MTPCVRTVAQSVSAPIICHSPTSRPYLSLWLDDGYNNAMSFFASFLEVYSVFDISILERNSPNVLKFLVALSLSAIAFLLISPVTLCFRCCSSIISKCVHQKLYVLLYDCVYNMAIGSVSAPMCVLTFNLLSPFLYCQTCSLLFLLSFSLITVAASFPIPELNVHSLLFTTTLYIFSLLICVVCHVRQSPSILSCSRLFPPFESSGDSLIFFPWSL